MNRRNWLKNAAGLLVAAPFVARSGTLMPVKPLEKGIPVVQFNNLQLVGTDMGAKMTFSYTEGLVVRYHPLYAASIVEAWREIDRELGSKAEGGILILGKGVFPVGEKGSVGEGFSPSKRYFLSRQTVINEPETWVRLDAGLPFVFV